jgi:hypothetical protein
MALPCSARMLPFVRKEDDRIRRCYGHRLIRGLLPMHTLLSLSLSRLLFLLVVSYVDVDTQSNKHSAQLSKALSNFTHLFSLL